MADDPRIGRYLRSLLPALGKELGDLEVLLLVPDEVAAPSPLPPGVERFRWGDAPEVASAQDQWAFQGLQASLSFDLLHVPHFPAPVLAGPPMVLTVFDLAPFHFPEECFSFGTCLRAKLMFRLAASRARRILTPGRSVAKDLYTTLGVSRNKIIPGLFGAPLGVPRPDGEEVAEVRVRLGVGETYLLAVGTQRSRKNLPRLLRAFAGSGLKEKGVRLVLAGPREEGRAEVGVEIRRQDLLEQVLQPDDLLEEDLAALYAGATGFLCPSLYEGFSFPILDAFHFGVPVACARAGALPEVCDEAAIFFDPRDETALAGAMVTLVEEEDRRQALIGKGQLRLEHLSWEHTARETVRAYREALGF
jgi:glycosyltransferase involved in cell wall biosynthesis